MPTTVQSAQSQRKVSQSGRVNHRTSTHATRKQLTVVFAQIATDAQKLSTWGAQRQTSSMNERYACEGDYNISRGVGQGLLEDSISFHFVLAQKYGFKKR